MNNTFNEALEIFIAGAQVKVDLEYASSPSLNPKLVAMIGRRYVRVVRTDVAEHSAHCFVDRTNGDVLKPAGWKGPAKGRRGNIFDAHHGLKAVTAYGAVCFR